MSVIIDMSGRVALITGAARGIGAATARAFAEAGANLVLTDRLEGVKQVAADLEGYGIKAVAYVADISRPENCEAVASLAMSEFGRLDYAFNNAGIGSSPAPVGEMADEDWHRIMDVNLNAVYYCIKHQVPAMLADGGGVIINNSSFCGVAPLQDSSIEYTSAKHGVIGLTRQVALNHAAEGIRCIAVCPGFIMTPLTDADQGSPISKETREWMLNRTPQGRLGQPEDVARVVRMLCSEEAAYINGAWIPVDGGLLLS